MLPSKKKAGGGEPEAESLKREDLKMRNYTQLVALRLLRAYQWAISPMLPPACRYVPTCSDYAMEAVERYGALRGGFMAIARLLRCHPFAGGGYDPVVKHSATCSPRRSAEPAAASPTRYHGAI